MFNNIYITQSKCKRPIGQKVILATMGAFLLRAESCLRVMSPASEYSKPLTCQGFELPKGETPPDNGISAPIDNDSLILGTVHYFKLDHHLGLIQIDPTNQPGLTGSKKMGVLFYASDSLKDCLAVHLSNKGVTVTYSGGRQKLLRTYIEVDGEWVDALSVEPLLHKGSCTKLVATSTTDFKIFQTCDYGIELVQGTNPIPSKSVIKLIKSAVDKTRLENKHHAGFMVTKDRSPATSALVELVKHICTETVQSANIISSASVVDNRLQPDTSASGEAPYFYIRSDNRYRLIPLGSNASSVTGLTPYDGPMGNIVVDLNSRKEPKKTSEVGVQTDDDSSSYAQYSFDGESWEYSGCSDNDDDDISDAECDTLSEISDIPDEEGDVENEEISNICIENP